MTVALEILRPSAAEARSAERSASNLADVERAVDELPSHERIAVEVPAAVLPALRVILDEMAAGHAVAVHGLRGAAEVSTGQAAEILGVSRPTLIDLLDRHRVQYRMAGTHRRIGLDEVLRLKETLGKNVPVMDTETRRRILSEMAEATDRLGLGY